MEYITIEPQEIYQSTLAHELIKLHKELDRYFTTPNSTNYGWALDTEKGEFLRVINCLEHLFFIDEERPDFQNRQINKSFSSFYNNVVSPQAATGFVLAIAPKSHYVEFTTENVQRLEVAENTLKEFPAQFIRIFTKNDNLYVYMNKMPTWGQLIKLKLLQWTIFEDKIKTPEPLVNEFLNGMLDKNLKKVNEALTKIFARPYFAERKYKDVLKIFQSGATQNIQILEDAIEDLQSRITNYENALSSYMTELHDKSELLFSMKQSPTEDFKPLIRYLSKHPYITNITTRGSETIRFHYEAPIIYFDKYILEKVMSHKTGIKRQILSIFTKDEYELMTRCEINFNTKDFNLSFHTIGAADQGLIGHPHIDRFKCFGNHNIAVRESAKNRDYIGAIEQISQAVLNLNFSDSYVVDTLLQELSRYPNKNITWRHKETGTMLTTREVLNQYEGKEDNDEETETLLF